MITCDVIRDLLPLYRDQVCSADSRELVEAHLAGCECCREKLAVMEKEMELPHIDPESKNLFQALERAWKKRNRQAFCKGVLLSIWIFALLAGLFVFLTQWDGYSIPVEKISVSDICCSEDYLVRFNLTVDDDVKQILHTLTEDGSFYITPQRSLITLADYRHQVDSPVVLFPPGTEVAAVAGTWGRFPVPEGAKRIYVGPVGNGILVWEEGMEQSANLGEGAGTPQ